MSSGPDPMTTAELAAELRSRLDDVRRRTPQVVTCVALPVEPRELDLLLAALEDSARIDWYESAHRDLYYAHDEGHEWLLVPGFPWQKSVRAAIDSARATDAARGERGR